MKRINSSFASDPNYKVITSCGCEHGKSAKSLGLGTYTSLKGVSELPKSAVPVSIENKCKACENSGIVHIDYGLYMALKTDDTNRDERVIHNALFVRGITRTERPRLDSPRKIKRKRMR